MATKAPKPKTCRGCLAAFTPDRIGQKVCGYKCAGVFAKLESERKYKAQTAVMKKALLDVDKAHWAKKAREACHAYIRERDKHLPCVSCGRHHNGQHHAGHYKPSHVNSALRYDERNIFKQCAPCNTHLSGNLGEYRKSLVVRLGTETVEWLDGNHEIKKWSLEELKAIEAHYKDKIKQLRKSTI